MGQALIRVSHKKKKVLCKLSGIAERNNLIILLLYLNKMQYHIFSPYWVCPLGAHVDFQHGLVTGFANEKVVDL